MTAYVVFLRESAINDPAAMAEYRRVGAMQKPPETLTPLAVYGAIEVLEGDAPDGAVILSFPSMEEASAWYHGEYQKSVKHRRAAADYRGFIVAGFDGGTG